MNASKFTQEKGQIQLDARVFGEEDGALLMKIEVWDNGIGIPKEKQPFIFITFEQVDGGLSRKFEGAGLGLGISKHLVELMGGKIWVESEPGNGAKFSFTFKVKTVHGEKFTPKDTREPKIIFKGKTLLLVEDIEVNRAMVMNMLEGTQIQIVCAENGWQAVELFTADPGKYNIILMDINMPGISGWEAARRIRVLDAPEGKLVKIISMTANIFQEDEEKIQEVGINDHLGKPIDFNALLHKLELHLS